MTRTVLIAGASGLVGAACVDAFLDGWDVIAVSRRRHDRSSWPALQPDQRRGLLVAGPVARDG